MATKYVYYYGWKYKLINTFMDSDGNVQCDIADTVTGAIRTVRKVELSPN